MGYTINTVLRSDYHNHHGEAQVLIRLTCNRRHRYKSTDIRLEPSYWNTKRQMVRRTHPMSDVYNQKLASTVQALHRSLHSIAADKEVDLQLIDSVLKRGAMDFLAYSYAYLDRHTEASLNTQKQQRVVLSKFTQYRKGMDVAFRALTPQLMMGFQAFMLKSCKATTVNRSIRYLKPIINEAIAEGLLEHDPTRSILYRSAKESTSAAKVKLTTGQIQSLCALDLPRYSELWHARRMFLLAYYFCGMRVGDLLRLRVSNIEQGRLEYIMGKTSKRISLPIPPVAHELLWAYQSSDGFLIPLLANASFDSMSSLAQQQLVDVSINRYNKHLKELARLLEWDFPLSSHVARHSFAYHTAMEKDVPINKLMILLGHTKMSTTMEYLKSLDFREADDIMMNLF